MATAQQQRELLPGDTVGAFRIERTLGVGGFGITYLALDTGLNVQVAIKEYFPQNAWRDTGSRAVHCYTGGAEQTFQIGLQRFYKEGQTLAQFNHPNIVRVRQILPANNTAYLVMDYEQGEELDAYLRRIGRPLAYQELENIFAPLLDGLRAVHDRGLLHLDIKPENIFLRADSTPVLIDFGGARHQLGQASRAVSFLVASDGYAPNEQYTGTQLQPTTDIYAVGATIYRCITGQVPADAPKRGVAMIDGSTDPLPSVRQRVGHGVYPEHFLQTLDDALSMRVSNRPQTVRELQQRLFHPAQATTPPQPVYTPPYPHPQPMPVAATNKTNWLPIIIGAIAVLVAVLSWSMASKQTAEAQQQKIQAEQQVAEALKQKDQAEQQVQDAIQQKTQAEQQAQDAIQQKDQAEQQATLLSKAQEAISSQPSTAGINEESAVLAVIDAYADVSGKNDPYAALQLYTEPMDYYSKKSASHDFIVKDSANYMDVYSAREFHVTSQPMLEWLSGDEVQATYKMRYTLCCKKNKDPVDGVNLMQVRLVRTGNNWKISAINSKKL